MIIATFINIFLWMIVTLAKNKNSLKKKTPVFGGGGADYGLRNWLKIIGSGNN